MPRAELCRFCRMPGQHKTEIECVAALRANMLRMLRAIGKPAICRKCQADVMLVRNMSEEKVFVLTPDGVDHYQICPHAGEIRRRHEQGESNDSRSNPAVSHR